MGTPLLDVTGASDLDGGVEPTDRLGPRSRSGWAACFWGGLILLSVGVLGASDAAGWGAAGMSLIFFVFLVRHLAFTTIALQYAPADIHATTGFDFDYRPPVTVISPAKNEELVIEGLVRSLLALDYPDDLLQVIVVDDASTDGTPEILDRLASVHSRLEVIHRPDGMGGGKSGALNAALRIATGDVVVVFDADHKPRLDVLRRFVRHFADPEVGAVQGRCIVRNYEESPLARTVAVDYYCGYVVNEYGRQALFGMPAYGGSNCAVRTRALRALGGWNEETVTEDTDVTLRLVLDGFKVRFDVTAIDTEESVPSMQRFWRQRYRWARGHQQAFRDYWRPVWRSKRLSFTQKIETTMFLLVFHIPVLCAAGFILVLLRAFGVFPWAGHIDLLPLTTLLFLGPLVELGAGLVVTRAPRRAALGILLFLPGFIIFSIVCAKSWIDGLREAPYSWQKTERTGHGQTAPVVRVGATRA